ncbi:MAG: DUF354 domain-containing protein [Candidatus Caldarchaeum sp.]|nr:DUF354 domain-containing protein [Candidatus Caldarchaeum sp.]
MAKIWLDILTPKQFWFFRKVGQLLRKNGHETIYTFRHYEQLTPFVEDIKEECYVVGEFGGASLRDKLVKSVERTAELLRVLDRFDCAVSSGSPEAARIAYGLALPHVLASDTPESPVNRLAAPVSRKILTPWIVGKTTWRKYCVKDSDIILYRALDPAAWIKEYQPDEKNLDELGLEKNQYVLIRSPEYKASYLRGTNWDLESYSEFLRKFVEKIRTQTVVLPRYHDETLFLKNKLGGSALVVEKPVKNHDLIYFATLFIGGGGTMTQEAALFGIPCFSIYPERPPLIIRYLIRRKLVLHVREFDRLLKAADKIIKQAVNGRDTIRRRAADLVSRMEDPAERVAKTVETITAG